MLNVKKKSISFSLFSQYPETNKIVVQNLRLTRNFSDKGFQENQDELFTVYFYFTLFFSKVFSFISLRRTPKPLRPYKKLVIKFVCQFKLFEGL